MQYQSHTSLQCIRKRSGTAGLGPGRSGYRAAARLGRPLVLLVVGASRRRAAPRSQPSSAACTRSTKGALARWPRRSVDIGAPRQSSQPPQPAVMQSPLHGSKVKPKQRNAAPGGHSVCRSANPKAPGVLSLVAQQNRYQTNTAA